MVQQQGTEEGGHDLKRKFLESIMIFYRKNY